MTIQEKIIDKVQKLLAKANDDATTPLEAQSFMLKAQAMMAKHGLAEKDVIKTDCYVVQASPHEYLKRMPFYYGKLSRIIAENFRCYSFISTIKGGKKIVFVGALEDVEIAKEVFNYATKYLAYKMDLVLTQLKFQRKGTKYNHAYMNDWVMGFLDGLHDQFKKQVDENAEWGLILVKDPLVNEAWSDLQKVMKKKKVRTFITAGSEEAYGGGFKEGNNFKTPVGEIEG